jgi:26S proteasome regulatory subunit T3
MLDDKYGIIENSNGQMYVRVLSTLNREDLKPNA